MKMPNGGFNPAYNAQLATDTKSRAILGVDVTNEGSDGAGLSEPMRRQVETRSGRKVEEHRLDGGYLRTEDLERAHAEDVALPSNSVVRAAQAGARPQGHGARREEDRAGQTGTEEGRRSDASKPAATSFVTAI